ncbi:MULTISPECIES: hypothetical protein [unclassified Streptomyces]|uniref:hypothetical protein n=1 Tax=unclassified Streptomyces TaxID=2593676 RepID=UPI0033FAB6FD
MTSLPGGTNHASAGHAGTAHDDTAHDDTARDRTDRAGTGGASAERPALVCARCGTPAEGLPPTWTCSVENGTRRYFCDACSRENLRSIEGRLDSTWW